MKKILVLFPMLAAIFFLSGCSLPSSITKKAKSSAANATFIKSEDGGTNWIPKIRVDDKKTIAGVDVLSMAINPADPNIIYIGTMTNGLFSTKDAGETWAQVPFADKAYNVIFDPRNPEVMYGSGVFNGRAKIFKRLAEGQEWKDIYTEPADGTTISALAISKANTQVLYAGTSAGVLIKTIDGGQTWVNLKMDDKIEKPIISIGLDAGNDSHLFFGIFKTGVIETKDGGATFENISKKIDTAGHAKSVYSLVTDPNLGGVAYVGSGAGIFRRDGGETWSAMNLIESSEEFPVRAIAINPKNSKEIIYSSAKAIYKSTDDGAKWATFQLETSKEIGILKYDQQDPSRIYAGLRSF